MRNDLTSEFVRSILTYDPLTGVFRWRENYWKSVVPGRVAGRINGKGYATISIKNSHYQSHRLAWLHFYGEWPNGQLDHINRERTDNRIINLRIVTGSENCRNRVYENRGHHPYVKGVHHRKSDGKWQTMICINKRNYYLGLFRTQHDAAAIYAAARLAERIAQQIGEPLEL